MTEEVEIPPWERLRRISEMSVLERNVYLTRWADELISQHGMDTMPRYLWTAYRDTIAAVLLSLVDDQATVSNHGSVGGTGRSNGFASQVNDAPRSNYRSDDVPPAVIRAWAQQRGIPISERGRMPLWVIDRYKRAHPQELQDTPGTGSVDEETFDPDTSGPKLQDFLQVLRGESHG